MLYRLLSTAAIVLLASSKITCGIIENKTGHTIILHSFSTHEQPLDITPKELSPYSMMNEAQINFTICTATTIDGKQYQIIETNSEQSTFITDHSLLPTGKTAEELRIFKKMASKLRRLEPLTIILKNRKISPQPSITKLN